MKLRLSMKTIPRHITFQLATALILTTAPQLSGQTTVDEARLFSGLPGIDTLDQWGVMPTVGVTGEFLADVDGGRDEGSAWEALVDIGLKADFEKLIGWEGGEFYVNAFYYHGNDLSTDYVGNYNLVSNLYTDTDFNVFNIYLGQSLLDDRLYLKTGQIAADDDFMVSETALLFINSAFGPLPTESGNIAAPIYPLAAPGAFVRGEPAKGWYVQTAVYAGDAGPNQPSNHGFEWRTGGSAGWAWFGETGVDYELLGHGVFKLGGFYATGDFGNFVTGATEAGLGAFYGVIDHQLLDPDEDPVGLSLFCRGSFTPDTQLATVSAYVDGGFSLQSLLFSQDALGLGCSHTWFADDYQAASARGGATVTATETIIEATYSAAVTDWLAIQPDLQYIINPHYSDRDALVIGARCSIAL